MWLALLLALLFASWARAADVPTLTPVQHFMATDNTPCVGCKLFTYSAGTTTKAATYTDSSGGTANTNPIILNSRGEANIWLPPTGTFKYVLAPPTDSDPPTNPIWTVDNIPNGAALAGCGAVASEWIASLSASGSCVQSQPIYTDIAKTASEHGGSVNCAVSESHSSNNVTFTLVAADGSALSATNPCVATVENASSNGQLQVLTFTSASTVTLNSGSTLGIGSDGTPFRVWFSIGWDGTTQELLVYIAADPNTPSSGVVGIHPATTTACNACGTATSLQTFYGTTSQPSGAVHRILGYASYTSGLPGHGQWSVSPDKMVPIGSDNLGPGFPMPNQTVCSNSTSTIVGNTTPTITGLICQINMSSQLNFAEIEMDGVIGVGAAVGIITNAQISRGISPTLIGNQCQVDNGAGGAAVTAPCHMRALDAPQSALTVSYAPYVWGSAASASNFKWNPHTVQAVGRVREIQG